MVFEVTAFEVSVNYLASTPRTSGSMLFLHHFFPSYFSYHLPCVGGVDPSDHQDTFDGLSAYLKSHKCHVARLLPRDFPSKSQIAVPVNSLLRQFLQMNPEVIRESSCEPLDSI